MGLAKCILAASGLMGSVEAMNTSRRSLIAPSYRGSPTAAFSDGVDDSEEGESPLTYSASAARPEDRSQKGTRQRLAQIKGLGKPFRMGSIGIILKNARDLDKEINVSQVLSHRNAFYKSSTFGSLYAALKETGAAFYQIGQALGINDGQLQYWRFQTGSTVAQLKPTFELKNSTFDEEGNAIIYIDDSSGDAERSSTSMSGGSSHDDREEDGEGPVAFRLM